MNSIILNKEYWPELFVNSRIEFRNTPNTMSIASLKQLPTDYNVQQAKESIDLLAKYHFLENINLYRNTEVLLPNRFYFERLAWALYICNIYSHLMQSKTNKENIILTNDIYYLLDHCKNINKIGQKIYYKCGDCNIVIIYCNIFAFFNLIPLLLQLVMN